MNTSKQELWQKTFGRKWKYQYNKLLPALVNLQLNYSTKHPLQISSRFFEKAAAIEQNLKHGLSLSCHIGKREKIYWEIPGANYGTHRLNRSQYRIVTNLVKMGILNDTEKSKSGNNASYFVGRFYRRYKLDKHMIKNYLDLGQVLKLFAQCRKSYKSECVNNNNETGSIRNRAEINTARNYIGQIINQRNSHYVSVYIPEKYKHSVLEWLYDFVDTENNEEWCKWNVFETPKGIRIKYSGRYTSELATTHKADGSRERKLRELGLDGCNRFDLTASVLSITAFLNGHDWKGTSKEDDDHCRKMAYKSIGINEQDLYTIDGAADESLKKEVKGIQMRLLFQNGMNDAVNKFNRAVQRKEISPFLTEQQFRQKAVFVAEWCRDTSKKESLNWNDIGPAVFYWETLIMIKAKEKLIRLGFKAENVYDEMFSNAPVEVIKSVIDESAYEVRDRYNREKLTLKSSSL